MLNDELKGQIQTAYRTFLENKSLKPRYGQRVMIAEVAKLFGGVKLDDDGHRDGDPAVAAIEAGTGTGKTVAYCLAGIPIAKHLGKPLVISTATVALQEQIVLKDLPDIQRNAGLQFGFSLAKGRGRYVCLSKLDNLLRENQSAADQQQIFADEGFNLDVDEAGLKLYTRMVEALGGNKWDGERDSWPEALEDQDWSRLTTDHIQCSNRRCGHFQQCVFYKAREGVQKVDVIVTNHDLVLADLALGGGAILPDPRDCLYIFDEAHHLPDKAISHFAHNTRLHATADWLEQLDKNLSKLLAQHPLPGELGRLIEKVPLEARELKPHQQFMQQAMGDVADFSSAEDLRGNIRPQHRFEHGIVPQELVDMGLELKAGFGRITDLLQRLVDMLKEAMDGEATIGVSESQAEEWYPLFGVLLARSEANWTLWTQFCLQDPEGKPPTARWLTLTENNDIEVHVSPILAAETLRMYLWHSAFAALATSATLTALGKFDRFSQRAGLPRSAVCTMAPSPFKHGEAGVLRVPNYGADPRDSAGHSASIIEHLPDILAEERGSLVLYSSRKQMLEVYAGLPAAFRERILVQGDLSKQELIRQHRKRVDEGKPSVIFGLASFAEGVDLPGKYCEHVVIAKIPFAVPDDPVEAALAEWIEKNGGNPFMEIAVPDASLRLIQACGRLLRTEQDSGTITVLDRRLVTQRYGKAILKALPPFRQEID
ncbi:MULTISPECIES: ATP-dependent DNA helicase DinG [Pseudomonas]|uniref:ATP-dependent DNA helicase DinG n=1 Tax=Pseudomonas neustonica TaxID=2487346 RepID=A0ABX9XKK7_9PSED|nr:MULTISPECIES: ATP-dependent DNA helicase DinG [Pseudomonas]MBA6418535.1 ATP-dependent DNA helicase DinG [Pseudomonas sp. 5Ae-yellow]ROZ84985.1 ATP-dependent DNA helicase DinG [Pseudomonas sp. SSM44]ROZ86728.1 ATP-dependent DNA helicase DinG [Pseudomonas neustonica]|tara:strand:+ start:16162 stop:18297 length:2136 start_codon:yes stop_codon:yes gene_type:complete